MKIRAIAPWFGGKRTMARTIVQQVGQHTQYFEPFCGSMAVLFAKEPSMHETVNDLHGDLINLARVLQSDSASVRLYNRLQKVLVSDDLLDCAEAELNSQDSVAHLQSVLATKDHHASDLERAYWYFIGSWMARNGVAGTAATDYQLAVRWTAGGGTPTVRFRSCTESIPAWHQRLQNVVILNRDAFDIIPRFDDAAHVAVYVDPPYVRESRGGGKGPGSDSGTYLHEFAHESLFGDDHVRLRDQLAVFKRARVVVSYYDSPRVRDLYDGWTFIDCARLKNLHQQNGRGRRSKEAPEVLIVNGPALESCGPEGRN